MKKNAKMNTMTFINYLLSILKGVKVQQQISYDTT